MDSVNNICTFLLVVSLLLIMILMVVGSVLRPKQKIRTKDVRKRILDRCEGVVPYSVFTIHIPVVLSDSQRSKLASLRDNGIYFKVRGREIIVLYIGTPVGDIESIVRNVAFLYVNRRTSQHVSVDYPFVIDVDSLIRIRALLFEHNIKVSEMRVHEGKTTICCDLT